MHILLITSSYPPEIRTVSYMAQEVAEEFTQRGHMVSIATCWPRYNLPPEAQKIQFSEFSTEDRIRVIRIKTLPHHKVNYLIRGIAQLILPYLFGRQIKRFIKQKIDAVIVYSPPLPLALLGIKIKKIHKARYLLNIGDIFPQNAIDLGIIKSNLIIQFFECMERKAYKNTDKIILNTRSNAKFLIDEKRISPEKIDFIPDWVDESSFDNIKTTGVFREKYGLKDKFIFLFAGILGPAQNLDFIIDIARKLTDIRDICFLFVGDGTEKIRLQDKVKGYGLQNVNFQPFVSPQDYPSLAKEANVGLVCLSSKNKTPVVPGKIFGFMTSSLPVVAFLNKESDGHSIIKEAECGYSMVSDDYEEGAKLIRTVFNQKDKLAQCGRNGYNYAVTHFSKKVCIDKLEKLIQ